MSVLLKEEQSKMSREKTQMVMDRWKKKTMNIKITNLFVYSKVDEKKGLMLLLALGVHCKELHELRKDLGWPEKPEKFTSHITLLEKVCV